MKVFQVLIKSEIFEKGVYGPEVRKAFWYWPSPQFTSGLRIEGNELLVPEGIYKPVNHSSVLLFGEYSLWPNPGQVYIEQPGTSHGFENLKLRIEGETAHVFTSFSKWRFSEVPISENHKIGELMPGGSLRFMANDRYDFSAAARKQRRYVLYDYFIHYLGQVKKLRYTDQFKPQNVPIKDWKEVDERKIIK